MPRPGQILLAEGNLPSGMEYPTMSLAILTEGQLMARQTPKAKPAKSAPPTAKAGLLYGPVPRRPGGP